MSEFDFRRQREELVARELRTRKIHHENVLQAMLQVPREEFVPESQREYAYRNVPLPIGFGQTISQPLIVAVMIDSLDLQPNERVLEIGTGSGYAAAILSLLAKDVFTVERHEKLAETARERLERLGYRNVHVLYGDGTRGWPEHAPYDAIVVAACGPNLPRPLLQQLAIGGKLVIPVGIVNENQTLMRIERRGENDYEETDLGPVRFVPLIGEAGWRERDEADDRSEESST